jgi:hypothetical protein
MGRKPNDVLKSILDDCIQINEEYQWLADQSKSTSSINIEWGYSRIRCWDVLLDLKKKRWGYDKNDER